MVKLSGQVSELFDIFVGLLQGEALSPLLFSIFVNDLENHLINTGCDSVDLAMINLFLLMYADDTVLLSDTAAGLQTMLNSLKDYTVKNKLLVNVDKTKIVIFRNGKRMEPNIFYYNNDPVEVVDSFCYLGLTLNYNGKFLLTQTCIAAQGKRAKAACWNKASKYDVNLKTKLSLFDTYVAPILNYGAEVWGFPQAKDVERVHLQYLKQCLGAGRNVCNALVYMETGRWPLLLSRKIGILKYWMHLQQTDNCLLKTMYVEMASQQTHRRNPNWIHQI